MSTNNHTQHMLMDDTDVTYKNGKRPIKRTLEDDLFDIKFTIINNIELKPDTDLAKLLQIINKYNLKINSDTDITTLAAQIRDLHLA